MSGLAGVFMRGADHADPALVLRMAATAPHRGSPRSGMVVAEPGFAAVQQATPWEDHASTLSRDEQTGVRILFDGRLDNREELAAALSLEPDEAREWPDARLALHGWRIWRETLPQRLLGDFALVIWDAVRRSVFCARDPMGVRPLFYFLSDRLFVFGSELRQVLAHPSVPREPDEATIAALLAGSLPRASEQTLYRGVRRLPHAHAIEVDGSRQRRTRYWTIDCARELGLRDDREYADAFLEVFDRAVSARLRGTGPIGAYLSGGLDSSSVMATAHALARDPGHAPTGFSLVFPDHPEANEQRYSQAVLRHLRAPGLSIVPPTMDLQAARRQVDQRRELPDFPHDATGDAVRRAMADRGIHIALTGSGGDVGLSGSHFHYADLLRRGRLIPFWKRYVDVARQPAMSWASADLLACAAWPLLPQPIKRVLRPLARRAHGLGIPAWISRGLAERGGLTAERPLRQVPPGRLARTDIADAFDNGWMHMALDMYQRGSLEWGIEDRHPFLDRRVIEFALSLPDEQRWQNGKTRYVLRHAMANRLPPDVSRRTDAGKGDFSPVYPPAIEALGGAAFFDGPLAVVECGWVVRRALRAQYERMRELQRRRDLAYGDIAFRLWVVAAIEMWYSTVFSGASGRKSWNSSQVAPNGASPSRAAVVA